MGKIYPASRPNFGSGLCHFGSGHVSPTIFSVEAGCGLAYTRTHRISAVRGKGSGVSK